MCRSRAQAYKSQLVVANYAHQIGAIYHSGMTDTLDQEHTFKIGFQTVQKNTNLKSGPYNFLLRPVPKIRYFLQFIPCYQLINYLLTGYWSIKETLSLQTLCWT